MDKELKKLGDAKTVTSNNSISEIPTKSELTNIFGDPNEIRNGWIGTIDSGGVKTSIYIITVMNGEFYFEKLNKAI